MHMTQEGPAMTFLFDSGAPGPTAAIVGGMHGNELAGIDTVKAIAEMFGSGGRRLRRGRLLLALGNPPRHRGENALRRSRPQPLFFRCRPFGRRAVRTRQGEGAGAFPEWRGAWYRRPWDRYAFRAVHRHPAREAAGRRRRASPPPRTSPDKKTSPVGR